MWLIFSSVLHYLENHYQDPAPNGCHHEEQHLLESDSHGLEKLLSLSRRSQANYNCSRHILIILIIILADMFLSDCSNCINRNVLTINYNYTQLSPTPPVNTVSSAFQLFYTLVVVLAHDNWSVITVHHSSIIFFLLSLYIIYTSPFIILQWRVSDTGEVEVGVYQGYSVPHIVCLLLMMLPMQCLSPWPNLINILNMIMDQINHPHL